MKITVCIGSSCHIKGSRQVVEQLQYLISENNLGDKVELGGTFCMGECQKGVCVTIDDEFYSVTPETVNESHDSFMLGGNTEMPIERHSAIYSLTLDGESRTDVKSAAIYSLG